MSGVYRYGFNGKENDGEVKGEGNQQDYGMRVYDPRVARFLSVDPLTKQYPHYTPYSYAGNKPVVFIDVDGAEEGIDNTLRRKEEAYLNNQLSEDKYRQHVRAMAEGGTIGGLIVVDMFLTRGKLSTYTLMGSVYHHNMAKTEEGRAAQNQTSKDAVMALGAGYVAGKIIGGSIRLGKNLIGFSRDAVEETNYLFRGSTAGYEGSPRAQRTASTPTSTDPAVATMFGVKAKRYGDGILQIALPKDLQNVSVGVTTNVLEGIEREIVVDLKPAEFAKRASVTITVDQARGILKNMGINIPARINEGDMNALLESTPKLTNEQINSFYKQAAALKPKE
ncbi:RHS repeat-associated protein [Chitinophaga sp. W3I9]|uniref:RHS repeat-associated core domain-containing protein n=1 Tax=Chitinophaga sp. W3I9 TaxID=3373924 RepID=UPI003D1DC09D